jgi:hypothetical protein
MCMSVLEGGIYFDELAGLPSRHLGLLMLGLLLALLGAIAMGIAGFVAEKPEHILHYSAAASQLAAAEGGGGGSQPTSPPALVGVIVERLQPASGRVDRLSSPVLRPGGSLKNGYAALHSTGSYGSLEGSDHGGKRRWQGGGSGGVTQVHAVAAPPGDPRLELQPRPGDASPLVLSPRGYARMQAVCSPTQQLLSRENTSSLEGGTPFERALWAAEAGPAEAGSDGGGPSGREAGWPRESVVLLDSRSTSTKGTLQRR